MNDVKEIQELIGAFGFPIFVTVYLLWERKNIANKLISRLDRLVTLLELHGHNHRAAQDKE